MSEVVRHGVAGLASGAVYALLALGVVLAHRATRTVNVAQGELATLSAFVCASLLEHGWHFWPAFAATIVISFAGGMLLERTLVQAVGRGPRLGLPLLTLGLFLAVNGLDTWIWGSSPRRFDGPFSNAAVHVAGVAISKRDLGTLAVAAAALAAVGLLLARTQFGLGLRALGAHPDGARLVGIRPPSMLALAWGFAAALGAVAGVLTASAHPLEPRLLHGALFYALVAVVLGGFDSPRGAVTVGVALGVSLELLGDYVHWVGSGLRLTTALALLLVVLLVRPGWIVVRPTVRRA